MKNKTLEIKLNNIISLGEPKTIIHENKKVYISKKKINELQEKRKEYEGGILPLVTLLPLIFGGIAAAGGVAGGVATAVSAANKAKADELALEEAKRHNKELENAVRGDGMSLNPYQGKGDGMFLNPYKGTGIKSFMKSTNLSDKQQAELRDGFKQLMPFFRFQYNGSALFLTPY